MSVDIKQFKELVVKPTLKYLSPEIPYSEEAVDLLIMTMCHESNGGTYLKQINGPALGYYQMEPATHQDIWDNYLNFQGRMTSQVARLTTLESYGKAEELMYNLMYATAMARVHYWRVPEPLPKKTDEDYLYALASYAKRHYNSHLGKAKATDYYRAYLEFYKE